MFRFQVDPYFLFWGLETFHLSLQPFFKVKKVKEEEREGERKEEKRKESHISDIRGKENSVNTSHNINSIIKEYIMFTFTFIHSNTINHLQMCH